LIVLRALGVGLLATLAWVILGYLLTMPLGLLFGWSGHPAIPDAPLSVYVGLYGVVLPAGCLFGAWNLVRAISRKSSKESR
jgi:hypothetical protein